VCNIAGYFGAIFPGGRTPALYGRRDANRYPLGIEIADSAQLQV